MKINKNVVVVVVMEEKQQKRGGDGKEQTCFGGSDGGNNKKGEEIKEIGVKKKKNLFGARKSQFGFELWQRSLNRNWN